MGEPPLWADPRRWGSLIGLAGGLLFIGSYSAAFGHAVWIGGWIAGLALVAAALTAHYIRPVPLGPLTRPRPASLAIYGVCVIGELAAINLGSRALTAGGHDELRPALIAAVVGLHFIPFAWAFGERMFYWLGGLVASLGALGLVAGFMRTPHAADAAAVAAGLVMLTIITLYARGRFAPRPAGHTTI
ncbi:MAG: hypothetical protein M3Y35_04120 [Actinomycetota bacterium]|nr:hypothetical protein [Actinomycetota bacterium]